MDDEDNNYDNFLKRAREEYGTAYYEEKAKELGVPFANLTKFKPEAAALASIPHDIAARHNVLPLRRQATILWLAVADPGDTAAMDEVRLASRCTIKPVLADPEMIRAAILRFYTGQT